MERNSFNWLGGIKSAYNLTGRYSLLAHLGVPINSIFNTNSPFLSETFGTISLGFVDFQLGLLKRWYIKPPFVLDTEIVIALYEPAFIISPKFLVFDALLLGADFKLVYDTWKTPTLGFGLSFGSAM